GHAGQGLWPEPVDPDDEHTGQRRAGKRDLQGERREPQIAPELAPVRDMARYPVGASEQLAGSLEIAGGERGAHRRARDPLAAGGDAGELFELEARVGGGGRERVDAARAPRAEAEVVADQQEAGAQSVGDDLVYESLWGKRGQRFVDTGYAVTVDAACGDRIELVAHGKHAL